MKIQPYVNRIWLFFTFKHYSSKIITSLGRSDTVDANDLNHFTFITTEEVGCGQGFFSRNSPILNCTIIQAFAIQRIISFMP